MLQALRTFAAFETSFVKVITPWFEQMKAILIRVLSELIMLKLLNLEFFFSRTSQMVLSKYINSSPRQKLNVYSSCTYILSNRHARGLVNTNNANYMKPFQCTIARLNTYKAIMKAPPRNLHQYLATRFLANGHPLGNHPY